MEFNKEKLIANLQKGELNGWNILAEEYFTELGFQIEDLKPIIQTHKSNLASPKTTIFVEGGIADECSGIYSLDFLYWLCGKLNINPSNIYSGRGSQALFLKKIILNKLTNGNNK